MLRPMLPSITRFSLLLGLTALFFTFSSCDNLDTATQVELKVNFTPGGDLFDPAAVYTINGTAVQFNTLRFYLSEVALLDIFGNPLTSDVYILAQPNDQPYSLGEFPREEFTGLQFNVGIDSATNHLDPTQYSSSNPLAPQSPNMHWSWTSGYIFVRIDGIYDADGDGTPDSGSGFEVHLGSDNFLSTLALPASIDGQAETNLTITLNYDPLALFTGVDFPTVNTTHTMDNMPMATKIKNNMAAAFTLAN